MFAIRENDYVAATFGIPVSGLHYGLNIVAAAYFSETKQSWLIQGRQMIENSSDDLGDERQWFESKESFASEEAVVDELRDMWKATLRHYAKMDKRLKKHHGFRLVREKGLMAMFRKLTTIPGMCVNITGLPGR